MRIFGFLFGTSRVKISFVYLILFMFIHYARTFYEQHCLGIKVWLDMFENWIIRVWNS